ncbi:MAG: flippase-like domain-containing protein [Woeseia sp.]
MCRVDHGLGTLTRNDTLKKSAWLVSLAGLLLFAAVVGYQGIGAVSAAVAVVGWGLVWINLVHLAPLVVDTYAWQILLDRRHRVGLGRLTGISWIGEAVNSLLPVALIGGGLVRARLLSHAHVPAAISGAAVVVDLTVAVISLILFSFAGVAVLLSHALPGHTSAQLLPGLFVFSLLVYGFYVAQRRGMFLKLARRIEKMSGSGTGGALSSDAARLDRRVAEIYERRPDFWIALLVRLLGWVIGAAEVWLALRYLGHPVSLVEALMLESLGQAIRSAAFVVPGALGVQEGAYLVLGASIGIAPHIGVALSLVKRVRELSFGVPALLLWHGLEVRRFRQRPGRKSFIVGGSQ